MRRPPALWERDDDDRRVGRMVPVSIGLHCALALAVLVGGWLKPSRTLAPPRYEVMLMGPIKKGTPGGGAVKAGDAAIPKTTAIPAPTAAPKSTEMSLPDPKLSAAARQEALDRMKKEAALKRLAMAGKATPAAANTPATAAATPGAGSAGDPGGDGGVEYGTIDGIPGAASYEQQLKAIVQEKWIPPTWINAAEPKQCVIRVVIGFDGKITSREFEQRSGDSQFDASAMSALIKADPLPPPPIDLKAYLAKKGIPLRFDSRTKLAAGGAP